MARIKVWNGTSWDYVGNDVADTVTTTGSQTLTNKTLSTGSVIDANVTVTEVLKKVYPVGSIYINRTSSTNPATLLGFGTWTQIQDKMIMARGSTYTADGGSATHTHSLSDDGYAKVAGPNPGPAMSQLSVTPWTSDYIYSSTRSSDSSSRTGAVGLGGDTDSGSTIPPHIVAYVWERTA